MTDIYKRFSQDMDLAGYSPRSIDIYVRAVRQLTKHDNKSQERITDEELRQYFLFKLRRGSCPCGTKK